MKIVFKSEKRAIRREWINAYLQNAFLHGKPRLASEISKKVREMEKSHYGEEMKAYA